jgi:hypothetical protein
MEFVVLTLPRPELRSLDRPAFRYTDFIFDNLRAVSNGYYFKILEGV